MQLTHFLLLAGALGAAAHPSGHARLHRSVEARRNGEDHFKAVHNKPIPKSAAAKVADPTPSAAPSPVPKVPKPSKGDESDSDEFIPFCGGTSSKSKRVTYEQVMYKGNQGTNGGCKWNSNLMEVPKSIAKKYKYVQEYKNVADEPYQVICANKMGLDGGLTGMFEVPGQEQLIFMLEPGETKIVVADSNTQGVCAFAPNKVPITEHGQYAGVWAEFDFENTSNKGWSGADCSSLVAQHYKMDVPGCRMSEGGVESIILAGGIGTNAYTRGMEKLDGIGLNIFPGRTVIKVDVGFA